MFVRTPSDLGFSAMMVNAAAPRPILGQLQHKVELEDVLTKVFFEVFFGP